MQTDAPQRQQLLRHQFTNSWRVTICKGFRKKMGGVGSGRWKDRARKTVESYLMLDVDQLSKKGCLRSGWTGSWQWIVGNEVFSITLHAEAERVRLSYAVLAGDGGREDVVDTISVVHLHCR